MTEQADLRRALLWFTTGDGARVLDWLRQRGYVTRTTAPASADVAMDTTKLVFREGRRSLVLELEQAIDQAKTEGPRAAVTHATTALSREA